MYCWLFIKIIRIISSLCIWARSLAYDFDRNWSACVFVWGKPTNSTPKSFWMISTSLFGPCTQSFLCLTDVEFLLHENCVRQLFNCFVSDPTFLWGITSVAAVCPIHIGYTVRYSKSLHVFPLRLWASLIEHTQLFSFYCTSLVYVSSMQWTNL